MALGSIHAFVGASTRSAATVPPSVPRVDDGTYSTFTFPGTAPMTITAGTPSLTVEYLVVSGGQGGSAGLKNASYAGGKGGSVTYVPSTTWSPGPYTITVGAGGTGLTTAVANGPSPPGGGQSAIDKDSTPIGTAAGTDLVDSTGGTPLNNAAGSPTPGPNNRINGGAGGAGVPTPFGAYGGGGGYGGGKTSPSPAPTQPGAAAGGSGGTGGGGPGGPAPYSNAQPGTPGTINTGGGGGGGGSSGPTVGSGGNGAPGVVIVRFLQSQIV